MIPCFISFRQKLTTINELGKLNLNHFSIPKTYNYDDNTLFHSVKPSGKRIYVLLRNL